MLLKRIVLFALLAAMPGLAACSGTGESAASGQPEVKLVEVQQVKREQASQVRELSGTLQPSEEAVVSFEIPGRVTALQKNEGDHVNAGDVLARIDASDYALQLARASAGVAQADATLDQVNNGAREEEITQAKLLVDKAKIAYEQAVSDFKRIENLYREHAVSQNDYENAKNRMEVAEKDLLNATQAYSLVTQGARREVKEQTRSTYDLAVIAKEQAELTLSKTELKAPFRGTIISKFTSVGQLVDAGSPIYRIGNVDTLKATLPVPDREISAWKPGDKVTLSLYGQTREAKVTKIVPAANQGTGTISVEVSVPNPKRDWFSGQVVKASRTITGKAGIYVPVEAVISRGEGQPHVFLFRDGKAVKTPVTIGELIDNKLEIASGIKEGDLLIVKGVDRLFDGDAVEAVGGKQP